VTSIPVERLLAALSEAGFKPKAGARGWRSHCPAHDDRKPSLNIDEGEAGRALVHCKAGCAPESVASAVGLSMRDLAPPSDARSRRAGGADTRSRGAPAAHPPSAGGANAKQPTGGRNTPGDPPCISVETAANQPTSRRISTDAPGFPREALDAVASHEQNVGSKHSARWVYTDAEERPVGITLRFETPDGKSFRPVARIGETWEPRAMPKPAPLYRLPQLRGVRRVFVVEGEKAADAGWTVGLATTTSAGGANAAARSDWRALAGCEAVILPDNDEPGEKYAASVARILERLDPPATPIVVRLPGLPPKGDLADFVTVHRRDHGDTPNAGERIRAEVEALADAAAKAVREGSAQQSSAENGPAGATTDSADCIASVRACDVEAREVLWLWRDYVPRGKVSLLASPGGIGKSTVAIDVAARVTRGDVAPDGEPIESGSVVYIACEEDPGDTLRPKLEAAGANLERVHIVTEPPNLPHDGPRLAALVAKIGDVRLVVVDTIGDVLGKADENKNSEVRAALAPLRDLAEQSGAAVLLIAHTRKGSGSTLANRVLGSVAFANLARSVLIVVRDGEQPDGRILTVAKSNLAARDGRCARFQLGGKPLRVEWRGECYKSEDELIALLDAGAARRGGKHEAESFLRGALRDGPELQQSIEARALAAGISERTLQRAKDSLGVRSHKRGLVGPWEWSLPGEVAPKDATGSGE
jgi:putative DNA primase/helicase